MCVFCKIVKGEIPAEVVAETPRVLAFKDINPQAPVHVLVIPKEHVEDPAELGDVAGEMFQVAVEVAKKLGIAETGFRMVMNKGPDAGQEVAHLHLHVLGGRRMSWPPG